MNYLQTANYEYKQKPEHQTCVQLLDTIYNATVAVSQISNVFPDLKSSENLTNGAIHRISTQLSKLSINLSPSLQNNSGKTEDVCRWIPDLLTDLERKTVQGISQLKDGKSILGRAATIVWQLANHVNYVTRHINVFSPHVNLIEQYLLHEVTKLELTEMLSLNDFSRALTTLADYNVKLKEETMNFINEIRIARTTIVQAYKDLHSLPVALLDTNRVFELEIVKTSPDLVESSFDDLKNGDPLGIWCVTYYTIGNLKESAAVMEQTLEPEIDRVIKSLRKLGRSLGNYLQSTAIDETFLM